MGTSTPKSENTTPTSQCNQKYKKNSLPLTGTKTDHAKELEKQMRAETSAADSDTPEYQNRPSHRPLSLSNNPSDS